MKLAKGRWTFLIALVALASGLSACGTAGNSSGSAAEGPEANAVRAARAAQNRAIAALDMAAVASYWTDDVEIRRGLGALAVGKDAYSKLFVRDSGAIARGEELIYQREPSSVEVSTKWPLAYETGTWAGHYGRADGPIRVGGRYAAQWVKRDGKWLIRGEVYVALSCADAGCESKALP